MSLGYFLTRGAVGFAALLVVLGTSHEAVASVASPGDSCINTMLTPYVFDWSIVPSGGTNAANALFCNSGTFASMMTIQSGGNVGIGTTSPSALLDVEASGSSSLSVGQHRYQNLICLDRRQPIALSYA